jgi:hypothetical protein
MSARPTIGPTTAPAIHALLVDFLLLLSLELEDCVGDEMLLSVLEVDVDVEVDEEEVDVVITTSWYRVSAVKRLLAHTMFMIDPEVGALSSENIVCVRQ